MFTCVCFCYIIFMLISVFNEMFMILLYLLHNYNDSTKKYIMKVCRVSKSKMVHSLIVKRARYSS